MFPLFEPIPAHIASSDHPEFMRTAHLGDADNSPAAPKDAIWPRNSFVMVGGIGFRVFLVSEKRRSMPEDSLVRNVAARS